VSEDSEKSERPSQFKLDEARKRGQVDKNPELSFWFGTFVGIMVLAVSCWEIGTIWHHSLERFLSLFDFRLNAQSLFVLSLELITLALKALLPTLLLVLVVSVATQIMYSGIVFSTTPLQLDFKKLNPVAGFKKLFSRKVFFDLIKNTLKILFIVFAFYWFLPAIQLELTLLGDAGPKGVAIAWREISVKALLLLMLLLSPFVLVDVRFGRWNFVRQMRMSKREVKDEHKKREGDPQIKSKQRKLQQEMRQRTQSLGAVKDADIIIVNPVHVAVALRFDFAEMPAPQVVSSGHGEFASLIREQARRYQIPIVQHKLLARQLIKETVIGGYVPSGSFPLLVPIFRWLRDFRQTGAAL
jgi:flagellar biosynthesis protein FlhB